MKELTDEEVNKIICKELSKAMNNMVDRIGSGDYVEYITFMITASMIKEKYGMERIFHYLAEIK